MSRRLLFSYRSTITEQRLLTVLQLEWSDHIRPRWELEELARQHVALQIARSDLDDAVARARVQGASWTNIAAQTGITRQSAHQRWGTVRNDSGAAPEGRTPPPL